LNHSVYSENDIVILATSRSNASWGLWICYKESKRATNRWIKEIS